ncbi:MAG: hypothetical protein AB7D06_14955 [Pedobacter sp.]
MTRFVMLLIILLTSTHGAFAQKVAIDYARFPVEMEAFFEEEPGYYSTNGEFAGIGMLYFSLSKETIEFRGFRAIGFPYQGQEADDKYEICFETFIIESLIPVEDLEYAFQARSNRSRRNVSGKIKVSPKQSGLHGTLEAFHMEEHGERLQGVMNRYSLPKSDASKIMLDKYGEVFLGSKYVALDFSK